MPSGSLGMADDPSASYGVVAVSDLRQFRFRAGLKELSSRVTNVAVLDLCQTNEMAGALEFTSVRSVPECAEG